MTADPIDVAIIGAGTAGLSAQAEVAKVTDSYRVFDPGPYGTTCARSACMPSKAFLQSTHDFHRRCAFDALGISGADGLQVAAARVLEATRRLRDGLVEGVLEDMASWRDTRLVPHPAVFETGGILRAGEESFRPRATVIATGSRPIVPAGWLDRFGDRILTSEGFFEREDLPARMAVIGLGAVGLELGQAIARLGVEVTGFDPSPALGGVGDPELQSRIHRALRGEMRIVQAAAEPAEGENGAITMKWDGGTVDVDLVLVAMGRTPNLDRLELDALGVELDEDGQPDLPDGQLNLSGTRIYFAGDAGSGPALLHEAADEGRVAGFAAARGQDARFRRRVPLRMVFCDPQIALAGAAWDTLERQFDGIVVGQAALDGTGRIRLQRETGGCIRIYVEKSSARLLGAAILAPEAEHMGHLLAYAISRGDDLKDLLQMPAYHPTHEEALRRAMRSALHACDVKVEDLEEIRCEDTPVDCDTSRG